MKFNTVIIGGGLAGLVAGISLQKAGQRTAIISNGQNALHFFSGSFESLEEAPKRIDDLFAEAGIRVHYQPGVRLMPLGTFRPAALSLEDISLFPSPQFGKKVLIVNFMGYHDFFSSFLAEGLEKQGMVCRIQQLDLPQLEWLQQSPSEMRSVQIARTMDRIWEVVVEKVRCLLQDEDTVVLPQVFGLQDADVPGRIRQGIPAQVVFAGTLPPSVPGIRTQMLLKRRYELLGGTYLMGDEATKAHIHDGVVHSIVTKNLDSHFLEADHFLLASGGFFSKGLKSNPFRIFEPVFSLDVAQAEDRSEWYHPEFMHDQPYLSYGVKTDETLHAIREGQVMKNLFAAGSILGGTRPELGSAAGLAIRSALAVVDQILKTEAE
ncbi:MAG: anaerobic glycerol-3-phosphate dehydrogenase subunit B [Bacteroidales bacterium]|nr:anaerobic glycerol-3-phosphate dehydrogenase subunit B [Bacteroidales bacterium]